MAIYLQLEGKTGKIYEYSKEEKEGFDKHESTKGNVSYRKYYKKGLYGTLQNVSIRDSKIGEQVQVTVKNGNEYLNLQFPLYTQSANVDNRYAESLIRFLPNLKKGVEYRFYPYAMEVEDSKYMRYGISVAIATSVSEETVGDKVEPALSYAKEPKGESEIPNLVWKQVAGKNRPTAVSQEAKDEFLYNHLKNAVEGHLAYSGSTSTSTPTQVEEPKKEVKNTTVDTDEFDDLPF